MAGGEAAAALSTNKGGAWKQPSVTWELKPALALDHLGPLDPVVSLDPVYIPIFQEQIETRTKTCLLGPL